MHVKFMVSLTVFVPSLPGMVLSGTQVCFALGHVHEHL